MAGNKKVKTTGLTQTCGRDFSRLIKAVFVMVKHQQIPCRQSNRHNRKFFILIAQQLSFKQQQISTCCCIGSIGYILAMPKSSSS
jgi:hypothetical protein